MSRPCSSASLALITLLIVISQTALAEDLPLTRNLPIPEFQNHAQDAKPYNFDAPPEGMFRSITMAEGFEEELGFRRTHEIVPVKPTDRFPSATAAIFVALDRKSTRLNSSHRT